MHELSGISPTCPSNIYTSYDLFPHFGFREILRLPGSCNRAAAGRKYLLRCTTITPWIEDYPLILPVGRGHLQHDDSLRLERSQLSLTSIIRETGNLINGVRCLPVTKVFREKNKKIKKKEKKKKTDLYRDNPFFLFVNRITRIILRIDYVMFHTKFMIV